MLSRSCWEYGQKNLKEKDEWYLFVKRQWEDEINRDIKRLNMSNWRAVTKGKEMEIAGS